MASESKEGQLDRRVAGVGAWRKRIPRGCVQQRRRLPGEALIKRIDCIFDVGRYNGRKQHTSAEQATTHIGRAGRTVSEEIDSLDGKHLRGWGSPTDENSTHLRGWGGPTDGRIDTDPREKEGSVSSP